MTEKKSELSKIKPAELEKTVLELHKSGASSAKIGLILRDKHGVPKAKLFGKKVNKILKENNIVPLSEKSIVQQKIDDLGKHISAHKHDYTAKRSLTKSLWAVKRLN